LLTSIAGLTFGMTMIWTIRIVGRLALGKEAMGFGDVTLMAMIGSYMGWQACLPILAASAFAALLASIPMAIVKSESTLPYGPYLSVGTVVVALNWNLLWNDWLYDLFNTVGPGVIFLVLVGMILPMFLLLRLTRFIKEQLIGTG
jgi:leader peptidase (prepilin peptidase)/N-methyltransferase